VHGTRVGDGGLDIPEFIRIHLIVKGKLGDLVSIYPLLIFFCIGIA
jgi:hypothetical protein